MNKQTVKNAPVDLIKEIDATKRELFNLKLSTIAGQVKDVSQFKKLRAKIARAFTELNQKNK